MTSKQDLPDARAQISDLLRRVGELEKRLNNPGSFQGLSDTALGAVQDGQVAVFDASRRRWVPGDRGLQPIASVRGGDSEIEPGESFVLDGASASLRVSEPVSFVIHLSADVEVSSGSNPAIANLDVYAWRTGYEDDKAVVASISFADYAAATSDSNPLHVTDFTFERIAGEWVFEVVVTVPGAAGRTVYVAGWTLVVLAVDPIAEDVFIPT